MGRGKSGYSHLEEGPDGTSVIKILLELFSMAAESKKAGYNIDYFPIKFVFESDRLYYVDDAINRYDPQWDPNHWDSYYRANRDGLVA